MTSSRTDFMVESTLLISSANLTDFGEYKCLFDNVVGVTEKVINLEIRSIDEEISQVDIGNSNEVEKL